MPTVFTLKSADVNWNINWNILSGVSNHEKNGYPRFKLHSGRRHDYEDGDKSTGYIPFGLFSYILISLPTSMDLVSNVRPKQILWLIKSNRLI